MKYLCLLLTGMLVSGLSFSQRVSNVRAVTDGPDVRITYDLEGSSPSDQFEVNLYSNRDNYSQPLKLVTGAVGKGIKPGNNLTITWNATQELRNFKGEMIFEVRATLMGAYYNISYPTSSTKIKKGKLMNINWRGGDSGEKVKIELLKSNQNVSVISESVLNQGSYVWTIPKSIKPSKGYQIKITNISDVESTGLSKSFTIGGKFPVAFVIIPGAIVVGAVAYLATQKPTEPPVQPAGEGLPLPPNPN